MSFDNKSLDLLTIEPGVYLMKDRSGKILYIGKAKNIKKRVKQYFVPGRDGRLMIPYLTSQIAKIDTIVTFSEKEALLLENTLIKQHQPKYNILLKDDKTFISLTLNHRHTWPMIKLIRYKGKPKGDGLHFGPFTSSFAAKQTLELMNHVFPLRQCSDRELQSRSRPCLLYSIKRCLAPCVNKCTKEEYDVEVDHVIEFLKGQNNKIVEDLEKEMHEASERLEFEKAGALLQRIHQIKHVTQNTVSLVHSKGKDCDVFSLYQEGKYHLIVQLVFREGKLIGADHYPFQELVSNEEEIWESFIIQHYSQASKIPPEILLPIELKNKKTIEEILFEKTKTKVKLLAPKMGEKYKLLELAKKNAKSVFHQEQEELFKREEMLLDLQDLCELTRCPVRIECFDTSNISGTDLVACMVSFVDGMPDKKRTRLFKIRNVTKSDDYGALREVLMRHYTKSKANDDLPDLALIDGGKGQLNVALDVFRELEIASVDIISLAKEESRHDKGLTKEKIFIPHKKDPILLPPRSSSLFILQRIRDEAHRVAITFHKKRREKRIIQSSLDQIPGIGPKKRTLLLKCFGSIKKIKEATKEELEAIKGLTKKDIESLINLKN